MEQFLRRCRLEEVYKASRDEDNILDQKYKSKNVGFLLNLIYDKRLKRLRATTTL